MMLTPNHGRKSEHAADGAVTPRLAEIRQDHGALTILVEGRPILPIAVDVLPDTPPTVITDCASVGVPMFRVRGLDPGWTGNGHYDYAGLDARLAAIAQAAPGAAMILEIAVDAPE